MLTEEQKRQRVMISQQLLEHFRRDPRAFTAHIVTQDETWVHHFDPETKSQSMQWKHVTSPTPKKFKSISSSGKVMTSIFWDSAGDNAPVHTAQVAVSAAHECGFKILPHPAYSPDLAPSDFFLFPQLKSVLRGRRFGTNEEVITAVEELLGSRDKQWFSDGLNMLEKR
ncbi:histone-lysine N-methyltransferase SETMAR-like [Haliotis cracherodii]|uniref:histone-lysine N-methyltransferase SETMAR-like n=1 Tax=Haliotis cracherodii TaxID=6455 RepID=UPI0039E9DE8D